MSPKRIDDLLLRVVDRHKLPAISDDEAAHMDRLLAAAPDPRPSSRSVLAALEAAALEAMFRLGQLVLACRTPLAPESIGVLREAGELTDRGVAENILSDALMRAGDDAEILGKALTTTPRRKP